MLEVPFNAQQAIDLQINGSTAVSSAIAPASLLERIHAKPSAHGVTLVVSPLAGIAPDKTVSLKLFDLHGRTVWQATIPVSGTMIRDTRIVLGKGTYLLRMDNAGTIIGQRTIHTY
jgi:hypothetical protein